MALVEVYERRGKYVNSVWKRTFKRADKRILWGKKSHENFLLSWFVGIKKTLHLIQ